MSTNIQIARYLRGVPSFAGVYDNAPPAPEHFRWGDVVIAHATPLAKTIAGWGTGSHCGCQSRTNSSCANISTLVVFEPMTFRAPCSRGWLPTHTSGAKTPANSQVNTGNTGRTTWNSNAQRARCAGISAAGLPSTVFRRGWTRPSPRRGSTWWTMRDSGCGIGDRVVTNLVKP